MHAAMMENALPVAAFGEPAKKVLTDVRERGRRLFLEDDIPAFVLQTAEEYEKIMDLVADMRVEHIAAERIAQPMGEGLTLDEYLQKHGMTRSDLDDVPEDDIG